AARRRAPPSAPAGARTPRRRGRAARSGRPRSEPIAGASRTLTRMRRAVESRPDGIGREGGLDGRRGGTCGGCRRERGRAARESWLQAPAQPSVGLLLELRGGVYVPVA